jgi:integrase/recombinase XerD
VSSPRPVRVGGPLAPFAAGFEEVLAGQGYRSASDHLYLMAQLSRWMGTERLAVGDLSTSGVVEFVAWRKASGYVRAVSPVRLSGLVDYLVGVGVVGRFERVGGGTPAEALIELYRRYLFQQRGFEADSVRVYIDVARGFLSWLSAEGDLALEAVTAAEVSGFVLVECRRLKVASAKAMTTRLRSLLRFLYVEGLTAYPLADAVPSVASWRLGSLPRGLRASQIAALLRSCDRRTRIGRRDFAVLVLLSRLGLRAGEVAGLALSDIDWRAGEVVVRGKWNRTDRLPVPVDVGEAITSWLARGRPACQDPSVVVRARAPHRALSAGGISAVVAHACLRAGLPPMGAHRLRHSAATAMLAAGGSLDEIGQVLRHQRRDTTAIYAKVDRRALAAVVRPWPGAKP